MPAKKLPAGNRPLKTLERVLSKAGRGSRTEARRWIATGRVSVNDRVTRDPDKWVDLEHDRVHFDGKPLEREERRYILLHKPAGCLTTYRDPDGRPTVYDLLEEHDRYLFHVGRLDLDTSGLLLMTNDAQFAERLTNPEYHIPKTYQVETSTHLTGEQLAELRDGLMLSDGPTRPAIVSHIRESGGKTVFEITITEGRNRQVRRMVEALGAEVLKLVRIAIGSLRIGDLASGDSRELTAGEVRELAERN